MQRFLEVEWEYQMEQHPTWASYLGNRRWNDRWEDFGLDAVERRHAHDRATLRRLRAIHRAALPPPDRLNYDMFEEQCKQAIEEHAFRWFLIPLNQRDGVQTINEVADSLPFDSPKDYEDWIARLEALPVLIEQTTALMREGVHANMMLPRIIMGRIPPQIDKQIVVEPEKSLFFKPFSTFPDSISAAARKKLQTAAKKVIAKSVVPAYRGFKEFFVNEYLPATPQEVGIWNLPNGEAMYAYFARQHTTTDMTPKEIHETGLSEVARIRAQMEAIRQKVGFRGTLQEFFQHLRTDPQFFYKTPEDLFNAYLAMSKRIDPLLVKMFHTLPRMPYGVEAIPEAMAPDSTTAYYRGPAADGSRAGTYFVNLYKPDSRPKWEMMALSLHEAVPGHHLQIALAMELGDLPKFRRFGAYTAYIEGWALYAESLGDELELYDDPYSKFGQLTYEMWRAVRLVVDTGIHAFRWSRLKAINYFLDHAPKTELDVVNEIDRYIAWPGQALAYKIGELKIKELRKKASHARGSKFDLKAFHDLLLKNGAVPLDLLDRFVTDWSKSSR